MMRFPALLACLAVLAGNGPLSGGATSRDPESCRSRYDGAVAHIDQEEAALRAAFDVDAAVVDAPIFQLAETEDALMADLAAARVRAARDYRTCLARAGPTRK